MKKSIRIGMVAAMLSIVLHLSTAKEEQSGTQNLTPAEVTELASYITKEKPGKEPTDWKKEASSGDCWYQAVIVANGEKITYAYFPASANGTPTLSLWWRKVGTRGQNTLWASGVNPDGTTTGGVDPKKVKVAMFEEILGDHRSGFEYREYWQAELNKRLLAGLTYFRKK